MNSIVCLVVTALLSVPDGKQADDSVRTKSFEGSLYVEMNGGHHHKEPHPVIWDFPHLVLDAGQQLGKGWSLKAEFEYERFYEDGSWGNHFRDNFCTNILTVNKAFGNGLSVEAGILPVPVGITNSFGPALTIYDPECETAVVPIQWHEGGIGLRKEWGKLTCSMAGYAYVDAPLSGSRLLGASARVSYDVTDRLQFATSAYWGSSRSGNIHYLSTDFMGENGVLIASLEGAYQSSDWQIDGSYIYNSDNDAHGLGLEIGYRGVLKIK